MQIGENQTDPDELKKKPSPTFKGSGVFAVPDPREHAGYQKFVVPNITYQDCVQRGAFCMAFKWVPRLLDPSVTTCPLPPNGMLCVKSCGNDLRLCLNGICA